MRALSTSFMKDLLTTDGVLHPLLERIKQDHTLMLSIRKDYINIYYRGGNILRVKEQSAGSYSSYFNEEYNKLGISVPIIPSAITSKNDCDQWVNAFQELKGIMDCYFSTYSKPEREFQQLIARENNFSTISNQSEYFVSDIEFADPDIGARFDILALQWLVSQRKKTDACRPALIEMKYGDNALSGSSGLIKHLEDIDSLIADKGRYQTLIETMESQFNQLDELGLMKFNRVANWTNIKMASDEKPEVIFILANHNPRSSVLGSILSDSRIDDFDNSSNFNLRFYVSSFSGYALHADCMVSLEDFRKLVIQNKSDPCQRIDLRQQ